MEDKMMKQKWFTYPLVLSLLAVLALAGCGAEAPAGGERPSDDPAYPAPDLIEADPAYPGAAPAGYPGAEAPTPDANIVPAEIMDELMADALSQASQADATITLLRADAVQWSDGSLGCPQPDMMYTQAIVPGYLVVFEVEGQELEYHVAESGAFVLCNNGEKPITLPSS
jgi:hypothetical protein